MNDIIKIDKLYTKFITLDAALGYYLTQCPVRPRPQTLEPNGGCKPTYHEFDKNHPALIWARLALNLDKIYKDLKAIEQMAYRFELYMYPEKFGLQDVANYHSVPFKELKRAWHYVRATLEDEFAELGLIPFPDNWEPAKRWPDNVN